MTLHFLDCCQRKSSFFNFCEEYLFLEGISHFRKYSEYDKKSDIIYFNEAIKDKSWKTTALNICKIISYFIFPPLVLFCLCGKGFHRSILSYNIHSDTQQKGTIPKHLDVRGQKWLSNIHLKYYFKYLGENFSDLQVPFWEVITPDKIKQTVIKDGHFDNEAVCRHHPLVKCKIEENGQPSRFKNILAFPLFVNDNHWTLVLIDRALRTVEFYDSKNYMLAHEKKTLQELAEVLSKNDPNGKPFQYVKKIAKTLQKDSFNCGPWILYFLEERLKNPNIDFNLLDQTSSKKMIQKFRDEQMQNVILIKNQVLNSQ